MSGLDTGQIGLQLLKNDERLRQVIQSIFNTYNYNDDITGSDSINNSIYWKDSPNIRSDISIDSSPTRVKYFNALTRFAKPDAVKSNLVNELLKDQAAFIGDSVIDDYEADGSSFVSSSFAFTFKDLPSLKTTVTSVDSTRSFLPDKVESNSDSFVFKVVDFIDSLFKDLGVNPNNGSTNSAAQSFLSNLPLIATKPESPPIQINLFVTEDNADDLVISDNYIYLQKTGLITLQDENLDLGDFLSNVIPVGETIGSLSVQANGEFVYQAANNDPSIQSLLVDETLVDTFNVQTVNGVNFLVGVVINGSADITNAIVSDGYLAGSTVFADEDGDFVLDWFDANDDGLWNLGEGESWTITDQNGNISFDFGSSTATLVTIGGTDVSTGLPFTANLVSPPGTSVINPITTLVSAIIEQSGGLDGKTQQEIASAVQSSQEIVASALGLPNDLDLSSFDPLAILNDPNADPDLVGIALSTQQKAVQIANLMVIAEVSGVDNEIVISNIADLVQGIAEDSNQPILLDLTSTDVIASALTVVNEDGVYIAPIDAVITNLSATNEQIQSSQDLESIVQTQTIVQSDLAESIDNALSSDQPSWIGSASIIINENIEPDTSIAQYSLIGFPEDQGPVSYAIVSAVSNTLTDSTQFFGVDENTGVISTSLDDANFNYESGEISFTVQLSAFGEESDAPISSTQFVVYLKDINESPVATFADDQEVYESSSLAINLTAFDEDVIDAVEDLRFELVGDDVPGLSTSFDGSWTFDASVGAYDYLANGQLLNIPITYKVADSAGLSDQQSIYISILGTNDVPTVSIVDVVAGIVESSTLSDSGSIAFADLDLTDTPTATEATSSVSAVLADGNALTV